MKTNHNRGFKARAEATSQLPQRTDTVFPTVTLPEGKKRYWKEKLPLSGKTVETSIHPTGGHNSEEKCRRGAKRNINRMTRKHENAALKKLVERDQDETN